MAIDTVFNPTETISRTVEVRLEMPCPAPAGPVLDYFAALADLAASDVLYGADDALLLHSISEGSFRALFIQSAAIVASLGGIFQLGVMFAEGSQTVSEPACQAATRLKLGSGLKNISIGFGEHTILITGAQIPDSPAQPVSSTFTQQQSDAELTQFIGRLNGNKLITGSGWAPNLAPLSKIEGLPDNALVRVIGERGLVERRQALMIDRVDVLAE